MFFAVALCSKVLVFAFHYPGTEGLSLDWALAIPESPPLALPPATLPVL